MGGKTKEGRKGGGEDLPRLWPELGKEEMRENAWPVLTSNSLSTEEQ